MDLGNDSIVMTTDSIVRFNTAGEFEVADHGAGSGVTYLVGYKSFDGSAKLVVDSIQINAPLITISKLRLNWLVEQVFILCSLKVQAVMQLIMISI